MEKADDSHDSSECTVSFSPSFRIYSGNEIAAIAERVADEEGEEFEFAILQTNASSSIVDGGLLFPVFDQDLVSVNSAVKPDGVVSSETVLTPLKNLFLRERDGHQTSQQTYSSSSSDDEDDDELNAIPSEIYCPWTPARSTAEMSPSGGCRKSKSTGSSSTSSWSTKGWRIRDLLKRSQSDGKQSLKFLNSNSNSKVDESSKTKVMKKKEKNVSAHEKFYLRNKAIKEEDKRKSYLPYKQDLVGLFANYGKSFTPF